MRARRFMLVLGLTSAVAVGATGESRGARGAQQQPVEHWRTVVEGTWVLDAWPVGDRVIAPPEGDGRWMLHDGRVMFMTWRTDGANRELTAGEGSYDIDGSSFVY